MGLEARQSPHGGSQQRREEQRRYLEFERLHGASLDTLARRL
jgi:hypothetical protein